MTVSITFEGATGAEAAHEITEFLSALREGSRPVTWGEPQTSALAAAANYGREAPSASELEALADAEEERLEDEAYAREYPSPTTVGDINRAPIPYWKSKEAEQPAKRKPGRPRKVVEAVQQPATADDVTETMVYEDLKPRDSEEPHLRDGEVDNNSSMFEDTAEAPKPLDPEAGWTVPEVRAEGIAFVERLTKEGLTNEECSRRLRAILKPFFPEGAAPKVKDFPVDDAEKVVAFITAARA